MPAGGPIDPATDTTHAPAAPSSADPYEDAFDRLVARTAGRLRAAVPLGVVDAQAPRHTRARRPARRPTPTAVPACGPVAPQALALDIVLDVLDFALTWVEGPAHGRPPHARGASAPEAFP